MRALLSRIPGLALALLVALGARALGTVAAQQLGYVLLDPLVLAILLGIGVRTLLGARDLLEPGIDFAAKPLLEVAIVLLGASVDLGALVAAGPRLLAVVVLLVALALGAGYAIARMFRLPASLSILLAAGNAICGNSAIAAVAPLVGARREHTAAAIAFTAVLGVVAVVGLPFVITPLGLSHTQFGVLAGLTVYAVPQVLAAAFPVSAVAGEMATLVKLTRVLLLGPVVLGIAVGRRHFAPAPPAEGALTPAAGALRLGQLVPWFIIGFVLLALVRSAELLPGARVYQARLLSQTLTLVAMAGLGLGVDLHSLRVVGLRVALAAGLSLLAVAVLALLLIGAFGIA